MALLVDDNGINIRLLKMYYHRRGIPFCTAKDGAQALRLFVDHHKPKETAPPQQTKFLRPFDLVLMDLQMPICDGIDATRQIRDPEMAHDMQQSTFFIVTGQDSPQDRSNAEEAGANKYLGKQL
jgi:CheY-like chemotaxis protein